MPLCVLRVLPITIAAYYRRNTIRIYDYVGNVRAFYDLFKILPCLEVFIINNADIIMRP